MEQILHVYANSVIDWYVAPSVERAKELAGTYMRDVCGTSDDEMDLDFAQEPDDKILRIMEDGCNEDETRVMTCGEWAKANGEGFLCSTEF